MSNSSSSTTQVSSQAQRYPYGRAARPPPLERPRSQLSRETSDSRESVPAMSSYLQERLERERKVNDSESLLSRASNDALSATLVEQRTVQSSPPRNSAAEGRRPKSSGGTDPAKKKGLGLKEMEQTLSTLHKQNFDLKLELFHRRERQGALETRVEELESEKSQTEAMNDQLILELEKRDKAVEEAVAMIVVLEARVEQLIREREMVRHIEHDGMYYTRSDSPSPEMTPKSTLLDLPQFDDPRALNRMPSFLSEHSENTANLRNVYLGVRGSVLSLPRMAEDSHEAERLEHNGVSSPTLSVLSESSFLSVYGQKTTSEMTPPDDSPPSVDGPAGDRGAPLGDFGPPAQLSTPSKKSRKSSASRSAISGGQFQNIQDILDMGGSPLQRLERLEMALTAMGDASRPATSNQEKHVAHHPRQSQPTTQPKTKQEKREALQRVLTQGHLGRELPHSQGLPPTPDTISTSTLRRFKNSSDTLSREQSLVHERSYLALSETTTSQISGIEGEQGGAQSERNGQPTQPASTTAFDSRQRLGINGASFDESLPAPIHGRPRSAGETTISRHRGQNGWDSDDSDGDLAEDVDSMASSFDPWLRESLKPNRPGAINPNNSASQAGPGMQPGRVSPDLFSFPVSSGGWAADAIYGSLGGAGYMGSLGTNMSPPMAEALDALGDSLPAPYFGSGIAPPALGPGSGAPPPPPNRRSSLHAQTGPTAGAYSAAGSNPASPARQSPMSSRTRKNPAPSSRNRSNSIDMRPVSSNLREIGLRQDRAATVPPKQLHLPPPHAQDMEENPLPTPQQPVPKQRHYPPTASQAPRPRGLNSLFRRSTGSAEAAQAAAPSSAPPTETTFKNLPIAMMGLPSWGRRGSLVDDDRESSTPPPILRSKTQPRIDADDGGGVPLEPYGGGAPVGIIPGSPLTSAPKPGTSGGGAPNASGGTATGAISGAPAPRNDGGKRKWLGLGRVTSLRKGGI